MIFKIRRRDRGFAQIDNKILENPNLSWKAKGLLCYLLSRPDDWKVMMGDLAARATDGVTAIRSALVELRKHGYARLELARGSDGTLEGSCWTVFEEPQRTEIQETLIPDAEIEVSPTPDNPTSGKSPPTNTDRKTNTERSERPRNELFDVLCEIEGSSVAEIGKKAGGRIATALKDIKSVSAEVTPHEIRRRAGNYRAMWPGVTLTANALATHWAKLNSSNAIHQKSNGRGFSGGNPNAYANYHANVGAKS